MVIVNGNREVEWFEGLTVASLLDGLGWTYSLITVTVNGEYVSKDDYEIHDIPEGAQVKAIHIAHGG